MILALVPYYIIYISDKLKWFEDATVIQMGSECSSQQLKVKDIGVKCRSKPPTVVKAVSFLGDTNMMILKANQSTHTMLLVRPNVKISF